MLTGHSMADDAGVILAADESVSDFLGRSRRDLAGMSYIALTHPGDRVRNQTQVDKLRADDRPTTIRKRYIRADGQVVWANVAISRLTGGSDAGRLLGTLGFEVPPANIVSHGMWRAAADLAHFDALRRDVVGADLASDLGWQVLMQIYLAEAERREVDAALIAQMTGLSPKLVTRWLDVFLSRELVEPCGAGGVGRQLTADGIERVERVLRTYSGVRQS